MGVGLQCFNASGALDMDVSTLVGRWITTVSISGSSGSYTMPSSAGTRAVPMIIQVLTTGIVPVFSVSGRVVSWQYALVPGVTRPLANVVVAMVSY